MYFIQNYFLFIIIEVHIPNLKFLNTSLFFIIHLIPNYIYIFCINNNLYIVGINHGISGISFIRTFENYNNLNN